MLYWGDALVDAAERLVGGEVEALGALLALTEASRIDSACAHRLAHIDRVVMPAGAVRELPESVREQFVRLGSYRLADGTGPVEVWADSLRSLLGREPSDSERLFGFEGAHRTTVLDMWWGRRNRGPFSRAS